MRHPNVRDVHPDVSECLPHELARVDAAHQMREGRRIRVPWFRRTRAVSPTGLNLGDTP